MNRLDNAGSIASLRVALEGRKNIEDCLAMVDALRAELQTLNSGSATPKADYVKLVVFNKEYKLGLLPMDTQQHVIRHTISRLQEHAQAVAAQLGEQLVLLDTEDGQQA